MPTLSISSIAWPIGQDSAVRSILQKQGVGAIDFVPCKLFPEIATISDATIFEKRRLWADAGISFQGAQALFFNVAIPNLFEDAAARSKMLAHLRHVFRASAGLGAKYLVFGSPNNRRRADLSLDAANAVACEFFTEVAVAARAFGVVLCLEPNPVDYANCDFMRNAAETAQVVRAVGDASIKMQLDTGAVTLNHEDISALLRDYRDCIAYAHISNPHLRPVGDSAGDATDHPLMAQTLRTAFPELPLCIEMGEIKTSESENLAAIERAIAFTKNTYL